MQDELDAAGLPVEVQILGLNAAGHESGNAAVCVGRDLPWLQDVAAQNVWASWDVVWRDVWIVDTENMPVAVYNLTSHDLGNPVHFAELKQMLVDVSNGNPP